MLFRFDLGGRSRIGKDEVTLITTNALEKLSISYAFAQVRNLNGGICDGSCAHIASSL